MSGARAKSPVDYNTELKRLTEAKKGVHDFRSKVFLGIKDDNALDTLINEHKGKQNRTALLLAFKAIHERGAALEAAQKYEDVTEEAGYEDVSLREPGPTEQLVQRLEAKQNTPMLKFLNTILNDNSPAAIIAHQTLRDDPIALILASLEIQKTKNERLNDPERAVFLKQAEADITKGLVKLYKDQLGLDPARASEFIALKAKWAEAQIQGALKKELGQKQEPQIPQAKNPSAAEVKEQTLARERLDAARRKNEKRFEGGLFVPEKSSAAQSRAAKQQPAAKAPAPASSASRPKGGKT